MYAVETIIGYLLTGAGVATLLAALWLLLTGQL